MKPVIQGRKLPPIERRQDQQDELPQGNADQYKIDEEEAQIGEPPNHDSGINHQGYLENYQIFSCFPVGSRITHQIESLYRFGKTKSSFVDQINQKASQGVRIYSKSIKEEEILKEENTNQIIGLKVVGTSQLQLDTNILHPFVRMHIVNFLDGCYIIKKQHDGNTFPNAIYNYETNTVINQNQQNQERERETCKLELVTAFSTNFCDMSHTTNSRATWNEEIIINISPYEFYEQNNIILFELLDFVPLHLLQNKRTDIDYFYQIAWGFIKPMGLSKLHIGFNKIQLYQYQFNSLEYAKIQTNRRESVPLVYFDFIWPQRVEYDAVLNIFIQIHDKPNMQFLRDRSSMNVFEIEQGDDLANKMHQAMQKKQDEKIEEMTEQEKLNLRRRRYVTDKTDNLPTKIAFKIPSAPLGCFRLAFNKDGNWLAAACTYKNSKTVIKIFSIESGILLATFKGHRNLIHDLQFSDSSKFLCSGSSDYTAKIWELRISEGEVVNEEDSDNFLYCTLQHSSYVYGGLFLTDNGTPLVATACFDARIRLWQIAKTDGPVDQLIALQEEIISIDGQEFDQFKDLLTHRHPNCLTFDGMRRLFVGDSLGCVHIYDIDLNQSSAIRQKLIINQEIDQVPINHITLMPPEFQDIVVHTRDNCIRIIDYKSQENQINQESVSGTITQRLFGASSTRVAVRSCASPKGEYIFAGSEDGKPHMWSSLGIHMDVSQFQYSLIGPVSDVAWNLQYHMVAVAGFGDEHPIVIYAWEREGDMNFIEAKQLQEQMREENLRKQDDVEINLFQPTKTKNKPSQDMFRRDQQDFQEQRVFGGTYGSIQQQQQYTTDSKPFGFLQPPQQQFNLPNTPENIQNPIKLPFG